MAVAYQFVLFTNDAVRVTYTDHSTLELSPCATTLVHSSPPTEGEHPLHGCRQVKQKTEFVTSSFSEKAAEAVGFRNRFAERPYLVHSLVNHTQNIPYHRCSSEVPWPASLGTAAIETLPDSSLRLHSVDRRASVTLAPCRQLVTLQYLCRVWGDTTATDVSSRASPEQATASPQTSPTSQGATPHTWVAQHFSLSRPPACVHHPLTLLTQYTAALSAHKHKVQFEKAPCDRSLNITDEEKLGMEEDVTEAKSGLPDMESTEIRYVCSETPQSLPTSCRRQHLHQWRGTPRGPQGGVVDLGGGAVKALCCKGILYRLYWSSPRLLEVYPGDGSLLRSKGLAGHYFQHFMREGDTVVERLYSVKTPPPDKSSLGYSVQSILSTASRLMEHLCALQPADSNTACWQSAHAEVPGLPAAPYELESATVPGLGRFTAVSSGLVRVTYTDRTCVEMWTDFSVRLKHCQRHSEPLCDMVTSREKAVPQTCTLLLPSGHYHKVLLSAPGRYASYIQPALEWVEWVNTAPDKRGQFYQGTLYDPQCTAQVSAELNRIKCFNYIVENQVLCQASVSGLSSESSPPSEATDSRLSPLLPSMAPSSVGLSPPEHGSNVCVPPLCLEMGSNGEMSMATVQAALQATSQAVADLDSYISTKKSHLSS